VRVLYHLSDGGDKRMKKCAQRREGKAGVELGGGKALGLGSGLSSQREKVS